MESYPFLRGGGEAGKRIRNFEWKNTSIGSPEEWPLELKTTCSMMLHSALPMLIWWGKDSIQFYNDAYVEHFNSDSNYHSALGQPGTSAWPETWSTVGPLIDAVLKSSEPTNSEACIFTYKDGKPEDVSWTFNYSAVLDISGNPSGVLVVCTECDTRDLETNSEQLHLAIEASQLATWDLNPNTHEFHASQRLKEWFGLPMNETFEYTAAVNAIPEKDRQHVSDAIAHALTWESGGHYEVEHSIINTKTGIERIVRAIGLTQFDENKQPLRFNGTIQDITAERKTSAALQESQNTLLALFDESPIAIATVSGDDLIVESANAFYAEIVGRKPEEFIGLPMMDAMPELKGQGFGKLMRNVMHTGIPYVKDEVPVNILRKNGIATIYINLTYKKRESVDGKNPSILVVATDVTQQVIARKVIEESEAKLRAVIAAAPAGIGLFVGRDLIIENPNQTFIDIVGKGPDIVGLPLREVMPELLSEGQPFLKILDDVFTTGVPFISPASLVKIVQNGVLNDNYYNISYTPVFDSEGKVYAILDIAIDVTPQIKAQQELQESERDLLLMFEESPVGIATMSADDDLIFKSANEFYGLLVGRSVHDIIGKPLLEALPELKDQGFDILLKKVISSGEPFIADEVRAELMRAGKLETIYTNLTYQPRIDTTGKVTGILVVATDVTQQVVTRNAIEASERKLRAVIEAAPAGIVLFVGNDLIIENPNQTFIDILGKGANIGGMKLREAMPELITENQPFLKILEDMLITGIPFTSDGSLVKIVQNGVIQEKYYNITYTPIFDAAGKVYAILDISVDVTAQIHAQQKLEESEQFVRSVFYNSPVAKLVYVGEDMILQEANEKMLEIFGKGESIIGKPVLETIPELKHTVLPQRYRHVLATGETHHEYAERIELIKHGKSYWGYYDYTYKALRNTADKIYGVICTAVEVTEQVIARHKLEEAEANMRGAVELAQLGTWSIDVATNALTYSDRLIEWFGHDPSAEDYIKVIPIIQEEDQERIAAAVARALNPESGGMYDETYTIIHPQSGKKKILHAQGKTIFDIDGKPLRMNGTAQDITIQMELQLALEGQVQERTEELAAINEELQVMNEELSESNTRLIHSNEELAQYAYVASHDLQEPLRKIRVFSSKLSEQKTLSDENKPIVDKINQSAERMTLLIKDLLNFSRLINSDTIVRPVNLNDTLRDIITDFELVITEKNATIYINHLPVIEGVGLQMNQLFYNLLGNALKFTRQDIAPIITIGSKKLEKHELQKYISKPQEGVTYFEIFVKDNGIGFDEQYSDQIFEVFKRLHSKELYPGSGIGLALCRRIVSMHGGALYSDSESGVGSVFHIILHD